MPNVGDPSIAVVGSIPWLTWAERNANGNFDMVVARYAASTDQWIRTSVVDIGPAADTVTGHLLASGGRPHVTFTEWDGINWEARVARW